MPKALPEQTPETQPFWDGAAHGELRIQRCSNTGRFFFYPQPFSPFDIEGPVEWVTVSGDATLYSYTISHRPAPGFKDETPYAIAVVQLAEGPRMMTNIINVPNTPEHLILDMALRVTFQDRGDITVPVFEPAEVAG